MSRSEDTRKVAVLALAIVAAVAAESWNDTFTTFDAALWTQQLDIEHCSDGACFYADPAHLFYGTGDNGEGLLVGASAAAHCARHRPVAAPTSFVPTRQPPNVRLADVRRADALVATCRHLLVPQL